MTKKYSEGIMGDLRERRDLDRHDASQDEEIMQMSKNEVLNEVLTWNGLIGYDCTIKNWIENIYGVELE